MADKPWKRFERWVAKFFNCQRNALSGRNSKITASDSLHPRLFLEGKHWRRVAIISLWDKTAAFAKKEKKIPVVAIGIRGRPGCWFLIKDTDLMRVALERQLAKKELRKAEEENGCEEKEED